MLGTGLHGLALPLWWAWPIHYRGPAPRLPRITLQFVEVEDGPTLLRGPASSASSCLTGLSSHFVVKACDINFWCRWSTNNDNLHTRSQVLDLKSSPEKMILHPSSEYAWWSPTLAHWFRHTFRVFYCISFQCISSNSIKCVSKLHYHLQPYPKLNLGSKAWNPNKSQYDLFLYPEIVKWITEMCSGPKAPHCNIYSYPNLDLVLRKRSRLM